MAIDTETLELLERRLAEKIETRVRGRLFRFYGAVGGVALSILSFVGYNIVTGLEQRAEDYAQSAVESSVVTANEAANEARDQAINASVRLEMINKWITERSVKLNAIEDDVNGTLARVNDVSDRINERLVKLQEGVDDAETQFAAQRESADLTYAGAGDLEEVKNELGRDLGTLAEQVALLEMQLRELRSRNAAPPLAAEAPSLERIRQVAETYAQQAVAASAEIESPTFFLQFWGTMTHTEARVFAFNLAGRGYTMAGVERLKSAAGLAEIRFFHEQDAPAAQRLANDIAAEIKELIGYSIQLEPRDFTVFKGAKPERGTLEIWLGRGI